MNQDQLEKLIIDVFNPQKGERVYILNDFPAGISALPQTEAEDYIDRNVMAETWHNAFSSLAKQIGFTVEDLIVYEPTGAGGAPLPTMALQGGNEINLHNLMHSWGEKDIAVGIAKYSPTGPIFGLIKSEDNPQGQDFRAVTMPGATMDMSAFLADYKKVAEKAEILKAELEQSTFAEITFTSGHKFYFDLRGNRTAHADGGQCQKPTQKINLPSGEAYICPYEGLDAKLGDSLTCGELPVMYGEEMVVYKVEQGKITEVIGEGKKAQEMREYFDEDSGRRFIAELGLGCNDMAKLCGMILQDEKIEGLHWAYGYNKYLGGAIDASFFKGPETMIHQDCIYAADAPIGVASIVLGTKDGKKMILKDGLYLPEILGDVFAK